MSVFDAIASTWSKFGFSHTQAGRVSIGQPLTVATAKQALSRLVLDQPLELLRPTAEALQEMDRQVPLMLTASMDHYCNGPRLVRFQNSGGRQIDVDAVVRMHARAGVLSSAVRIQHEIGDVDDRRGRLHADDIGHRDIGPLAAIIARELAPQHRKSGHDDLGDANGGAAGQGVSPSGADSSVDSGDDARHWLVALYDQLPDIVEACGGHVAALATVLCTYCAVPRESLDADDTQAVRTLLVRLLDEFLDPVWREPVADPTATTTAYMQAVEILRAHGLTVPQRVELA